MVEIAGDQQRPSDDSPRQPRALLILEAGAVGALALATLVVHNLSYVLTAPYWLDESWVAISTKLPLRDEARDSSSTPLGWTLLLRVVVFGGEQRYRLLPLVFAALTAVMGYLLARSLPWRSRPVLFIASGLSGFVGLMSPAMLVRDDLKQYTADAFVTLALLFLLSRLEASWTRRGVIQLAVAIVAGFLISTAAAFVGASVLLSAAVVITARRRWRQLVEVTVASIGCGVALLAIFLLAYRPGMPSGLTTYWNDYYLPVGHGWGPAFSYLWKRCREIVPLVGFHDTALGLVLFALGVLTLTRLQRPAVALTVPLLICEMIAMGAARRYPLFDERTSTFLLVAIAVVAAIGIAGACSQLALIHLRLAVATVTVVALLFVIAGRSFFRSQALPGEDLRGPARYVAAHRQPGDVTLVSALSTWGFAYYWPHSHPSRIPDKLNLQGFETSVPDAGEIVLARDTSAEAVETALATALVAARSTATHSVWLVREHIQPAEAAAWQHAFADLRVTPQSVLGTRLALIVE